MGRSRGGLTTKIHALVDANGLPLRFELTGGQVHDSQAAAKLLDDLQPDCFVLADKAYDADWIRQQIDDQDAVRISPIVATAPRAMISTRRSIASAIGSSASSTASSTAGASRRAMRSSPPTTSP